MYCVSRAIIFAMEKSEINKLLNLFLSKRERTIVIVDYGNVEKWKNSLLWDVGIRQLGKLVKHFSFGKRHLRRFYYGSDFGKSEQSSKLVPWSKSVLDTANFNGFEVVTKRVKYIHSRTNITGFEKKCDLDVEMAVDLIKERDSYDTIIVFSGDGDMAYVLKYLREEYGKESYIFAARGHIGRELIDAKNESTVKDILFAEDFEYRLNSRRFLK